MRQIFANLLILTILFSCKEHNSFVEERLNIVDSFVACLTTNTPDKILAFTYPDADHKINDKEFRDFYVNKASKFIKKFGLPPKKEWVFKYDPQNNFDRLLVRIPVFKGYDSALNLLKADIIIAFPPPQISDKIYRYEIEDEYIGSTILAAPQIIDTAKIRN